MVCESMPLKSGENERNNSGLKMSRSRDPRRDLRACLPRALRGPRRSCDNHARDRRIVVVTCGSALVDKDAARVCRVFLRDENARERRNDGPSGPSEFDSRDFLTVRRLVFLSATGKPSLPELRREERPTSISAGRDYYPLYPGYRARQAETETRGRGWI